MMIRLEIHDRDRRMFSDDEIKLYALKNLESTDATLEQISDPLEYWQELLASVWGGTAEPMSTEELAQLVQAAEDALPETNKVNLNYTIADLLEVILTDPDKWSQFQAMGVSDNRSIDITAYIKKKIQRLKPPQIIGVQFEK